MFKWFATNYFHLSGWKLSGAFPDGVQKCVIIGAPHTSNWDFIFARAGLYLLGQKVHYLIKKELFIWPLSWFFRSTGGIPVDRAQRHNTTQTLKNEFDKREQFVLTIAPEGTRKRVNKWKTGFYFIAMDLEIPILITYLDYKNKIAGIHHEPFHPTGNLAADMEFIQDFYQDKVGKVPKNFNPKIY